jgi:hypothetical protein
MAGALAFVVAEIALRMLKLAPSKTVTTVSAAEFGRVPGLLSPGTEIVDLQNPALPHRVRVDSLGFRGQDFSRVPPEGTFRIAMLGDSFVYGTMVDDEATLPAQLQQRLAPRCGPVEVVNAAASGAGGRDVHGERRDGPWRRVHMVSAGAQPRGEVGVPAALPVPGVA